MSPTLPGWISAAEAARLLDFAHSDHIMWLAKRRQFATRLVGKRRWMSEEDFIDLARHRASWLTWAQAAACVGCSPDTIGRAVSSGRIQRRRMPGPEASLAFASVLEFKLSRRSVP